MPIDNNKAGFSEELAEVADEMRIVLAKARDLRSRYFDTGISEDVNAVENDTDLVPETTFDKATMIGMITTLEQFVKFMDNEAVTQNTYRVTVNKAAALRAT